MKFKCFQTGAQQVTILAIVLTAIACSGSKGKKETSESMSIPGEDVSSPTSNTNSNIDADPPPEPSGPAEPVVTVSVPVISSPSALTNSPFVLSGSCTTGNMITVTGDFSAADLGGSHTADCLANVFSFTVSKDDGDYNFTVTASQAGASPQLSTGSVSVDNIAPVATTLIYPPLNTYTSADNPLTIQGTCDEGNIVELAGDGVASTTCSGGAFNFDFIPLGNQIHTLELLQKDQAGNSSEKTILNWIYNDQLPGPPTIDQTGPIYSNTNSTVISGTCSDTAFLVNLAGSGLTGATDTCTAGSPNTYSSLAISAPTEGAYVAEISQSNAAGKSGIAQISWIYDASVVRPVIQSPVETGGGPDLAVTQDGPLTMSGSCEAGATVSISPAIEATASDSDSVTCTSEGTFTLVVDEPGTITYHYDLKQVDLADNDSGVNDRMTEIEWTRNPATPPQPTVTSPSQPYFTSDDTVSIQGSCIDGNTILLYDENPPIAPEVASVSCSSSSFTIDYNCTSGCAEGSYSWSIAQFNGTNESFPHPFSWTVDQTAPILSINSTPFNPNETPSVSFEFSATDANEVSYLCKLDDGPYAICSSPKLYIDLASGSHTFTVKATDAVGLEDLQSYMWTQVPQNTSMLFHFDGTSSPAYNDDESHVDGINNLTGTATGTSSCGKFADCYDFNFASSQDLKTDNIGEPANLPTQMGFKDIMTIEAFVKIDNHLGLSNGQVISIASRGTQATGDAQWALTLTRKNPDPAQRYRGVFHYSLDGSSFSFIQTGNIDGFGDGLWHHVAVTLDQGSVTIWIDGVSQGSGSIGATSLYSSSGNVFIGSKDGANYFDGQMDEFRISNTVRYLATFTPTNAAFVAD